MTAHVEKTDETARKGQNIIRILEKDIDKEEGDHGLYTQTICTWPGKSYTDDVSNDSSYETLDGCDSHDQDEGSSLVSSHSDYEVAAADVRREIRLES